MGIPERVADLTDAGLDFMDPYFWKSEKQVVLLRHVPGSTEEYTGHFEALVVDLATQHLASLEAFNALCATLLRGEVMYGSTEGKPGQERHYIAPHSALSPDGQWLAAYVYPPGWVVAPLEPATDQTPQTYGIPEGIDAHWSGIHPVWMPDSRHWVALILVYENDRFHYPLAVVHDIENPTVTRSITINDLPGLLVLGVSTVEPPSGSSGEAIILHDMYLGPENEEPGDTTMVAVPLDEDTVQPERWTVTLPPGRHLSWVASLSPDGQQLAWLLHQGSLLHALREVWVSGISGESMRLIASVQGIEEPNHMDVAMHLAWLPNGRAVSYRFRDALWVVSLD